MYLNYSILPTNANGALEPPELVLQTLAGDTIGVIPGVSELKMNVKFAEPSEITFDVASVCDGIENWTYNEICGHRVVYTEHYGIYVIMNPERESDGLFNIKHVKGYSLEKTLEAKRFFLEEGTFKFHDITNSHNPDTIIGRILDIAVGWDVGYVSPTIAQRYRTFGKYDDNLLSFIYNTAPEKYRCVFVFDSYEKKINVYDADEEHPSLPIYLDFDNLVASVSVEELSDELVTAIRPYGADELDIREVNPIGTNWIYDLGYFVSKGDIPAELAQKYNEWQAEIQRERPYFEALSALSASASARLLAAEAALVDMQGELDGLIDQQNITIQALASETTSDGKESQQNRLDEINTRIAEKKNEISSQETTIEEIKFEIDANNSASCAGKISAIVEKLKTENYFTDDEYKILSGYLIEQDITDNTFVASDIDTAVSAKSYQLENQFITIVESAISEVDLTDDFEKRLYAITGGTFSFKNTDTDENTINGDVIRGTLEVKDDSSFVLSAYAGALKVGDSSLQSGVLTLSGTLANFTTDITDVPTGSVTTREGTTIEFSANSGMLYITANINDFERYSVKRELYDYGAKVLKDLSVPTYEFSVESGNFLFAKEFAPFRRELELGKGIYLNIGEDAILTPYIIEFELDFENRDSFSLVFSNRFKRHDAVNSLSDMIEKSYSSSRSFEAGKYTYNQVANQATMVSEFMSSSLEAAKNSIVAATNNSVVINGTGIHVGEDGSPRQIRIVNDMIAMTDDNWATSKLAVGYFKPTDGSSYFGINAEVIGGNLIVGENLIIESKGDDDTVQFKVDSSGAWLNNSSFVLQGSDSNSGKIIIAPNYGIIADKGALFTTQGTTIIPLYSVNENGKWVYASGDNEGNVISESDMPSFYLDINSGNAYFGGDVKAKTLEGNITGDLKIDGGRILLSVIDVVKNEDTGQDMGIPRTVFEVDNAGNVTMSGGITMSGNIDMSKSSSINFGENGPSLDADTLYSMLIGDGEYSDFANKHFGIFSGSYSELEVFADYVTSDGYYLSDKYGGVCRGMGEDDGGYTRGAKIYGEDGPDGDIYVIATGSGCRMSSGDDFLYVVSGRIGASTAIEETSDERVKNSITHDLSRYEDFFMNLSPTVYKFNNGSSGRFHSGFIAQEVEQALLDAGLTTQDFAGFVRGRPTPDTKICEENGIVDGLCTLRYSEFIAMNTYMIQRLYHRIEELENKLNKE